MVCRLGAGVPTVLMLLVFLAAHGLWWWIYFLGHVVSWSTASYVACWPAQLASLIASLERLDERYQVFCQVGTYG